MCILETGVCRWGDLTELKHRKPDAGLFCDSYTGEYPEEAPFTISELEEIYPCASGKSKVDEEYRNRALEATHLLQQGKPGIWLSGIIL